MDFRVAHAHRAIAVRDLGAEASWREAACGTVFFHDARGKPLKTLYLGRMPESGKVTLKAQLASEVAHIRQLRPDVRIVASAAAADNRTFLETLSPETQVIDFWHSCEHLQRHLTMRWPPTGSRGTARSCVTTLVASTR